MLFGICGGPDLAKTAREAGFAYWEWSVPGLLKPLESDDAFAESLKAARETRLPCPVLNQFLPATHKVTGPSVDMAQLRQFVTVAFDRAQKAGVTHIVFGSGGARQVPDGFDHRAAQGQIADFLRMAGPLALANKVTIALEPLNPKECNIVNSVAEGAAIVRAVDHPAVRLLVDSYHMLRGDNRPEDIVANGPLFAHTHVATKDNRAMPGTEPCDLVPFFSSLKQGGYNGRVSFEGSCENEIGKLAQGLAFMKQLAR